MHKLREAGCAITAEDGGMRCKAPEDAARR